MIDAARANGMTRLTAMTLGRTARRSRSLQRLGFLRIGYDGDALEYELVL